MAALILDSLNVFSEDSKRRRQSVRVTRAGPNRRQTAIAAGRHDLSV